MRFMRSPQAQGPMAMNNPMANLGGYYRTVGDVSEQVGAQVTPQEQEVTQQAPLVTPQTEEEIMRQVSGGQLTESELQRIRQMIPRQGSRVVPPRAGQRRTLRSILPPRPPAINLPTAQPSNMGAQITEAEAQRMRQMSPRARSTGNPIFDAIRRAIGEQIMGGFIGSVARQVTQ